MGFSTSLPTSNHSADFTSLNFVATAAYQDCNTSHLGYFEKLLSGLPASNALFALQINENLSPSPALNLAIIPYCTQNKAPFPNPSTHLAFNLPVFSNSHPFSAHPCILLIWGSPGLNKLFVQLNLTNIHGFDF